MLGREGSSDRLAEYQCYPGCTDLYCPSPSIVEAGFTDVTEIGSGCCISVGSFGIGGVCYAVGARERDD